MIDRAYSSFFQAEVGRHLSAEETLWHGVIVSAVGACGRGESGARAWFEGSRFTELCRLLEFKPETAKRIRAHAVRLFETRPTHGNAGRKWSEETRRKREALRGAKLAAQQEVCA
jgi:hypothetical protein